MPWFGRFTCNGPESDDEPDELDAPSLVSAPSGNSWEKPQPHRASACDANCPSQLMLHKLAHITNKSKMVNEVWSSVHWTSNKRLLPPIA